MPTPCARDGRGVGLPYGLPDLIEPGGTRHHLLPTPTAVPYGTNQSPSAGAAVRPSLDSLARGQLLPTPTVADSRSSANATAGRTVPLVGHAGRTLTDAARLLPTPRATDGSKGCPGQRGSHGDLTLPSTAVRFLPTPRASDGHGANHHGDGGEDLTTTIAGLATEPSAQLGMLDEGRWGEYATAVARWELLLGRPVPDPSQPGRHGKPVLAPPFVEWLMGLPELWVTDPQLGLPRTRALRVLGNGVVPQQAAAALCLLLDTQRWAVPA
ncbi:hypothetical protein GCM10020218_068020 [Dactylosporangium vinaceum]